jgi:hypothetical protein
VRDRQIDTERKGERDVQIKREKREIDVQIERKRKRETDRER